MAQIRIQKLGLAAFVKMKGATLIAVEDRAFVFESEKSETEWQLEYSNSCCMQHDALVCQLRNHIQRKPS